MSEFSASDISDLLREIEAARKDHDAGRKINDLPHLLAEAQAAIEYQRRVLAAWTQRKEAKYKALCKLAAALTEEAATM